MWLSKYCRILTKTCVVGLRWTFPSSLVMSCGYYYVFVLKEVVKLSKVWIFFVCVSPDLWIRLAMITSHSHLN